MRNYLLTIVGTVAVMLGIAPAASATKPDMGISFDLAPNKATDVLIAKTPDAEVKAATPAKPLPLPDKAAIVPTGTETIAALPPPPESLPAAIPVQKDGEAPGREAQASPPKTAVPSGALQFWAASPQPQESPAAPAASPSELQALFHGEENSLVARAVGSAEGTRTPDGGHTWAYQGHTDPGNQAWNLGSFSYQHGASSPADADRKQLQRLMGQAQTLRSHAATQGVDLTLEAELNGIDLANQSPRAALSVGGYIDRLKQAQDMGLQGSDAVLWARTRAFLDPDTSRWNAPGLGNTIDSITADQERRREAIARTIETQPQIASAHIPAQVPIESAASQPRRKETAADPEAVANLIISLDLPPT